MVFDWFALWVEWKRPEAVEMDLLTETSGHCVHEEASGRTLDVDIVSQPIPIDKEYVIIGHQLNNCHLD